MRPYAAIALALVLAVPAGAPASVHAPAGVRVTTAVASVPFPTNLAFDPAGGIWIASGAGNALSSDGVWYAPRGSTHARHVVTGLHTALGLTWFRGDLYIGHVVTPARGRVTLLTGFDGRRFATERAAVPKLKVGRHTVDTIVPGPDRRLYVGVGSVGDTAGSGHVFSFRPGGAGLRVEAGGVRNPYGLAFVPGTRRLLVTDNARDDLGPFLPPDELDAFDVDAPVPDFGFPACYDQGGAACAGSVAPIATFAPHASSDGIAVTRHWGRRGLTAFVAENGSSFAANPTGNDVRIVRLGRGGRSASQSRFAYGFASHDPLGAAIGPDGALYVTLFASGKVLRFSPPSR